MNASRTDRTHMTSTSKKSAGTVTTTTTTDCSLMSSTNSQTKTLPNVDPKIYNSEYYRSSNYADYLERADRYKKTAYELVDLLRRLNLISKDSMIVDYGCAVGFLLEGFKELGYPRLLGYEISDWAVQEGRSRGNNIHYWGAFHYDPFCTKVMTALAVFEHMTDEKVSEAV